MLNRGKIFCRASGRQRLIAGVIFLAIAGFFGLFVLAARGKIDIGRWLPICGFKQRYNLPCFTCGMTAATLAFAKGKIFQSFYTQPAAALLWCVLVIIAFLAFLTAGFGVYSGFLKRFVAEVKIKYLLLGLIVIIIAGWAVTLSRALAN